VWLPAQRVLCTGDLFIWAAPNCGNPQKVQRYVREWAVALDAMRALAPEVLLPGHGPPIVGAARCAQALGDTAALLHTLHDQTVAAMNAGLTLDDVVAAVTVPHELLERPYLRPVYDDPAFIVRNVWRRYGGWWDGNPAHLLPPRERALAAEVAALAGGAAALVARAEAVAADDLALACQLAEWAAAAAPDDTGGDRSARRAVSPPRRGAVEPDGAQHLHRRQRGSIVLAQLLPIVGGAAVQVGFHVYFWRRLVRDPGWSRRGTRTATVAIIALGLSTPITIWGNRAGVSWLGPTLGWVSFPWMALVALTVATLLVIDVGRLGLRLARRWRRAEPTVDPSRRRALARMTGGVAVAAGCGDGGGRRTHRARRSRGDDRRDRDPGAGRGASTATRSRRSPTCTSA
jgi:hypothetical protein